MARGKYARRALNKRVRSFMETVSFRQLRKDAAVLDIPGRGALRKFELAREVYKAQEAN